MRLDDRAKRVRAQVVLAGTVGLMDDGDWTSAPTPEVVNLRVQPLIHDAVADILGVMGILVY